MSNLFGKWGKQLKNRLVYASTALVLLITSIGTGLPMLTTPRVSADSSQAICQGYTTDPATVLPAAPTLVSPSNGVIRNEQGTGGFYFMWNAPANDSAASFTYQWESGHSASTDPETGNFTDQPFSDAGLTTTYVYDKYSPSGIYYWHVRAISSDGRVGPWSDSWMVNLTSTPQTDDVTVPTAIIGTDNGQTYIGRSPVNIVGSASDDNPANCDYVYTVRDANGNMVAGPIANIDHFQWNNQDLNGNPITPDGAYTLTLQAWDASGNYTTVSKDVIVDNTLPVVTLTKPQNDQTVRGKLKITGKVTDQNFDSYTLYLCGLSYDSDGSPQIANLDTCIIKTGTSSKVRTSIDTIKQGLPDGTYVILLMAQDKAGNMNDMDHTNILASSNVRVITIDNTSPTQGDGTGTGGGDNNSQTGNSTSTPPQPVTIPQILTAVSTITSTTTKTSVLTSVLGAAINQSTVPKTVNKPSTDTIHTTTNKTTCSKWFGACWYWTVAVALVVLGALFSYTQLTSRSKTAAGK